MKLDNQFKVYGVKKTNEKFVTVFKDYSVLYNENLTTSNTNKWEYVKDKQTIKYWDYSASEYRFVAGSPISAFTFKVPSNGTTVNIESATITGLGGHIVANTTETANTFNPVYVAEPKVVAKADYKNTVQFNFVRQQSMVRVGFTRLSLDTLYQTFISMLTILMTKLSKFLQAITSYLLLLQMATL